MPGTADKSYGIHVAELAGMPGEVVDRASFILEKLEIQDFNLDLILRFLGTSLYNIFSIVFIICPLKLKIIIFNNSF